MYHVIIAGGVGSRFWPISRENNPKQFINLIDNKSLIKLTYNRLLKITGPDKIFILTPVKYKDNIVKEFPNINLDNIIYEPAPKNTAPAIYLASKHIYSIDNQAKIGIYPSDHYIKNENEFTNIVNKIDTKLESKKESIITIGIVPQFASSSYGYINVDKNVELKNKVLKINKFIEKPNLDEAKVLIKENNNLWNSGMFFFNAKSMIGEIEFHVPKIKSLFSNITSLANINNIWDDMPKISIDYAVMEKTTNAYCLESTLKWSDLGTWLSLYKLNEMDKNNNVLQGNVISHNSSNNLIISKNRTTAIVGLENVAIINLEDVTLVIDLTKSEEVRHIIDKLDKKIR